ncbi:MAG: hypothetical protein KVP17_002614 [Porospora cf. gigantea B]|uniref:uncharacterized protein n=1 Tax=Porospora cf. gigantea B TaxID=2853592 RepID=UPI003571DBB6|nr:MAG: hypothetical protein KVP17_002614 [Porospora cf. gigantea B]
MCRQEHQYKRHPPACVFFARSRRSPDGMATISALKTIAECSTHSTTHAELAVAGIRSACKQVAQCGGSWLRSLACCQPAPACRCQQFPAFDRGYYVIPLGAEGVAEVQDVPSHLAGTSIEHPKTPQAKSEESSQAKNSLPFDAGFAVHPGKPFAVPLIDRGEVFTRRRPRTVDNCRLQPGPPSEVKFRLRDLDPEKYEFAVIPPEFDDFVSDEGVEPEKGSAAAQSARPRGEGVEPEKGSTIAQSARPRIVQGESQPQAQFVNGYLVVPPQYR